MKTKMTTKVNDDGQLDIRIDVDRQVATVEPIIYSRADSAQIAACIVAKRINDGSWDENETLRAFVCRIFPTAKIADEAVDEPA